MENNIYGLQQEKAVEIERMLSKWRGTDEYERSKSAFHGIITNHIHGGNTPMSDEEITEHFERALTTIKDDIRMYKEMNQSILQESGEVDSTYYILNVRHHRHDQYFEINQNLPISGEGNEKLSAIFEAQNLYEKSPCSGSLKMPPRVKESPLPNWDTIVKSMTDRTTFDSTYHLTDSSQADAVFKVTSAIDWTTEEGWLFLAPELADGSVFSPALYSVYFFGENNEIFIFVTADGFGVAQEPFVGLVNHSGAPDPVKYSSLNRSKFSYLSNAENPANYSIDLNDNNLQDFNLGVQTSYPNKPDSYITVNAAFSGQVSPIKVDIYKHIPGLSTIMMIQKGTLMKDLVKAYFPDSSSAQLWEDIGALPNLPEWLGDVLACGLDALSAIFSADVWDEKPNVNS